MHKHVESYTTLLNSEYNPSVPPFSSFGLTEKEKGKLYSTLERLSLLFSSNEITHFAICGTLLGIERHTSIIPWDDDADIGILKEDEDKVRSVKEKAREIGLLLVDYPEFGYRAVDISQKYDEIPYVDIFVFERVPDMPAEILTNVKNSPDKWQYKTEFARKLWPKEYILEHELFPLRYATFGNIQLPIPNKPREILDRAYPSWETVGYIDDSHRGDYIGKFKILF